MRNENKPYKRGSQASRSQLRKAPRYVEAALRGQTRNLMKTWKVEALPAQGSKASDPLHRDLSNFLTSLMSTDESGKAAQRIIIEN